MITYYSTFTILKNYLVKIGDNFIEQSQTFNTLVVAIQFHVEFMIIGNGSEQHTNFIVTLIVKFLRQRVLQKN